MGFKLNTSISRQIGILICLTLGVVMGVFLLLIWVYTGRALSHDALYALLGYMLAAGLLTLIGVRVVIRRFVKKPLLELTAGLKRAERGDFLYRVAVGTKNELGQLAEDFNFMMSKFTDLMATQLDTERVLDQTQRELKLKSEVARQSQVIRQTNEELQARIKYLSLLYDIGNSINSIIEPDQLYQSLVNIISEQLGFEEFAVLILNQEADTLEIRASHGYEDDKEMRKIKFRLGEGISGIVAQTGKRQLIRDTAKDPRYLHYKGLHKKDGAFLCIPLKVKGSVLGVFNFFRPKRNGFTAQEIRLLSAIANQAAIAIENAQLFNNTRQLSVTDELTGLANRRHFKNMLDLEKKRSARFRKPLSILMVDVDFFKKFNDTHGHLEGDHVLKKIAQILSHNVREVDLVARFGGEEFIVLLPNTSAQEALLVAEKLREIVERTPFPGEESLPSGNLTISIGCASCPEDTTDMDELENRADIALYEAKRRGKNAVVRYRETLDESQAASGSPQTAP